MDQVKRVRYFKHEFLDAADFNDEQNYHCRMRHMHNRYFHTWGIGHGLEVNFTEGQERGTETKVTISPGTAVDGQGREIVLAISKTIDFNQPGYEAGKSYYVTIQWQEQPGLPSQQDELKRWEEVPFIETGEGYPEDPEITLVLAKVTLKDKKIIAGIDHTDRRYATLVVGDNSVTSAKIVKADGSTGQDTTRGEGIKTGHIQDRAVTAVKLDEDVEKSLAPVGCVAAFAMETSPDGWLECNGQAIRRTDYERLFNTIGITFGSGNGDTTFNVPDLRGEFIRGWDGGTSSSRGLDPNRTFGSQQQDQMQSHKHIDSGHSHGGDISTSGSHSHRMGNIVKDTGGVYGAPVACGGCLGLTWPGYQGTPHPYTDGAGNHNHSVTISDNTANLGEPTASSHGNARHGNETRPINVALMYCIKY